MPAASRKLGHSTAHSVVRIPKPLVYYLEDMEYHLLSGPTDVDSNHIWALIT